MSRFYGSLEGQAKTVATRRGGPSTGITAHPRGWNTGVRVSAYADGDTDVFSVNVTGGSSGSRVDLNVLTIEEMADGFVRVCFGLEGFEHYYTVGPNGTVVEDHPLRQAARV